MSRHDCRLQRPELRHHADGARLGVMWSSRRSRRWRARVRRGLKNLVLSSVVIGIATTVAAGTTQPFRSGTPEVFGDHTVANVIDGDTVRLTNGLRVRLAQIDAPEVSEGECYADDARETLASLLPVGSGVKLERDRRLDGVDRYGRLIRYVVGKRGIANLELVRRGAASVWFVDGDRGRYARQLLRGAREARHSHFGLWRRCPGTELDTSHGVQTGTRAVRPAERPSWP
jgi:endonuclease YncB( thermonuclease family)